MATMVGIDAHQADFRRACLKGADSSSGDFSLANLEGANPNEAHLHETGQAWEALTDTPVQTELEAGD